MSNLLRSVGSFSFIFCILFSALSVASSADVTHDDIYQLKVSLGILQKIAEDGEPLNQDLVRELKSQLLSLAWINSVELKILNKFSRMQISESESAFIQKNYFKIMKIWAEEDAQFSDGVKHLTRGPFKKVKDGLAVSALWVGGLALDLAAAIITLGQVTGGGLHLNSIVPPESVMIEIKTAVTLKKLLDGLYADQNSCRDRLIKN